MFRRIAFTQFVVLFLLTVPLRGAEPLAGTAPLTGNDDLAEQMLAGMDRFLDRRGEWTAKHRAELWHRDVSSPEKYAASVAVNRQHLAAIVGLVDKRVPFESPELIATVDQPALVGREGGVSIFAVRWPAIGGIWSEGLLVTPDGPLKANVIAIPDADQTPEMLCGLTPGIPPKSQFALRLAESGCRMLVPALISRDYTFSVSDFGRAMNLPHREWVYRPAFQMGRTIIGYELQKILAGVDWFDAQDKKIKIGVFGYGEGGLLALYAGALDTRIQVTAVSGYFDSRQKLWNEPIYRNLQGLLTEFSDAEIGSLVAPHALLIEATAAPQSVGPVATKDRAQYAAPGVLTTPDPASVEAEFHRLDLLTRGLDSFPHKLVKTADGEISVSIPSDFLKELGLPGIPPPAASPTLEILCNHFDDAARQHRLIDQMQQFTQQLVRESSYVRADYWAKANRHGGPEKWKHDIEPYRQQFEREIIGIFDGEKLLPPNVRTRQIFDEPAYTGYEVLMDVYPDVIASGILLVPKGIKPGEHRPVVVCQHGLDGHPRDVADPAVDSHFYHRFACRLAEQGFVTYAPQNLYFGGNRFRQIVRKANPLGATLWTFVVAQHRQQTDWLASLPFIDASRIAFYGLSYGGKTAVYVPPVVNRYCLSISSGDFNEWTWKMTSLRFPAGYPSTPEYEMYTWNMGNQCGHAEMAGMIAPRPFMVERGHNDGVGIDEWVGYEYARVKHLYDDLGIGDRTAIEWFNGPHMINGVGTFEFLHKQLNWPAAQ